MEKYRYGLKVLGCEIGLSMVYQNQFKMALKFFDATKPYSIYSAEEVRNLKKFTRLHLFRLERIKWLDRYYANKVYAIAPKENDSVGVISFNHNYLPKNRVAISH